MARETNLEVKGVKTLSGVKVWWHKINFNDFYFG